jgi:hypothetical protein
VKGFRDVKLCRNYIVEQREHDEVEHDRHDHFVRAELHLEPSGNRANDSSARHCCDYAEKYSENSRQ